MSNPYPTQWRPGGFHSPGGFGNPNPAYGFGRPLPSDPFGRPTYAGRPVGSITGVSVVRPFSPTNIPAAVSRPQSPSVIRPRPFSGPLPVVGASLLAIAADYFLSGIMPPPAAILDPTPGSPADYSYGRSWPRPDTDDPPLAMGPAHAWLEAGDLRFRSVNSIQWAYPKPLTWTGGRRIIGQSTNGPQSAYIQNQLKDPPTYPTVVDIGWVRTIWGTKYEYYAKHYWYSTPGTPAVAPRPGAVVPAYVPGVVSLPGIQPPITSFDPVPVDWVSLRPVQNIQHDMDPLPEPYRDLGPVPAPIPDAPPWWPGEWPWPVPEPPRSGTNRRRLPRPGWAITVTPTAVTAAAAAPHVPEPPQPPDKERKTRTPWGPAYDLLDGLLGFNTRGALDATTEALQFIAAIYYALPEEYQDAGVNPYDQAVAIYDHFDELDIEQALENIALMLLTDAAIGQAGSQAAQQIGQGGYSGPATWYGIGSVGG